MDLFTLLDNIQVDKTSLLDPADQQYCEKIFKLYCTELDQLDSFLKSLDHFTKLYKKGGDNEADPFKWPKYHISKALSEAQDKVPEFTERLIDKIEYHIRTKYKVTFDDFTTKLDRLPAYTAVTDNILRQIGSDFKQTAFRQKIASLHDCFSYKCDMPEIKGKKLILPDYGYFQEWGHFRIGHSDSCVKTLFDFLCHFNTGEFNWTYTYTSLYDTFRNNIRPNEPGGLGERAAYIQLYKNGKVTIEFDSPESVQDFWNAYSFDTIVEELNNASR